MQTIDDLKCILTARLTALLSGFTWRFEAMTDDPYSLAIGVFSVPVDAEQKISRIILDLDWELCQGTLFGVVPMLRDPEVTRTYYPQYAVRCLLEERVELPFVPESAPPTALRPDAPCSRKRLPDRPARPARVANQELALAA